MAILIFIWRERRGFNLEETKGVEFGGKGGCKILRNGGGSEGVRRECIKVQFEGSRGDVIQVGYAGDLIWRKRRS